jgi:hypothetical protein
MTIMAIARSRKSKTARAERTQDLPLRPQESDALRITRELAREQRQTPKKTPVYPDKSNRYIAD